MSGPWVEPRAITRWREIPIVRAVRGLAMGVLEMNVGVIGDPTGRQKA
ncbi:MAG: hypothetical protein IPK69_13130 [Phycisphaerales bacterium]|nr:MAG: hypothetical protein IPK69_13130 [Phycisphaerales bacterium]